MDKLSPNHSLGDRCWSTLLLSHVSQRQIVFAMDDAGVSNRTSPLSKQDVVDFVVGPTEETLTPLTPLYGSAAASAHRVRRETLLGVGVQTRFHFARNDFDACSATLRVTS